MKHGIKTWYQVELGGSYRRLPAIIDNFLDGEIEFNSENSVVLRDFDGDFDGLVLYNASETNEVFRNVCEKLGIDYEDVKEMPFRFVS